MPAPAATPGLKTTFFGFWSSGRGVTLSGSSFDFKPPTLSQFALRVAEDRADWHLTTGCLALSLFARQALTLNLDDAMMPVAGGEGLHKLDGLQALATSLNALNGASSVTADVIHIVFIRQIAEQGALLVYASLHPQAHQRRVGLAALYDDHGLQLELRNGSPVAELEMRLGRLVGDSSSPIDLIGAVQGWPPPAGFCEAEGGSSLVQRAAPECLTLGATNTFLRVASHGNLRIMEFRPELRIAREHQADFSGNSWDAFKRAFVGAHHALAARHGLFLSS